MEEEPDEIEFVFLFQQRIEEFGLRRSGREVRGYTV